MSGEWQAEGQCGRFGAVLLPPPPALEKPTQLTPSPPFLLQLAAPGYFGPQTQLKYAVEIIISRSNGMLGVVEPVLERVVFEDAPGNLAAIKQRVEAMQVERRVAALEQRGEAGRAAVLRRRSSRPRLADMLEDFTILAAELERCYGRERALPSRTVLRDSNRWVESSPLPVYCI